jgi:hypothetical protein
MSNIMLIPQPAHQSIENLRSPSHSKFKGGAGVAKPEPRDARSNYVKRLLRALTEAR